MRVQPIPQSHPLVRTAAVLAGAGIAGILLAVVLHELAPSAPKVVFGVVAVPALVALAAGASAGAVYYGWNIFAELLPPLGRWMSDMENWFSLGRAMTWVFGVTLAGAVAVAVLWSAGNAIQEVSTHTLLVLILLVLVFK